MNIFETTVLKKKASEAIKFVKKMPEKDINEGIRIIQEEAKKAGYKLEIKVEKL